MRTNPASFIEKFEAYTTQFDGNLWYKAGQSWPRWTREGVGAVNEAIEFLKKAESLPPFTWNDRLAEASEFHTDDIGPLGLLQHNSSDGTDPFTRMKRFGTYWSAGENISFGSRTAEDIVEALFIDDGVPSRGHRNNIMSSTYKVVGNNNGSHAKYGVMTTLNYADKFD